MAHVLEFLPYGRLRLISGFLDSAWPKLGCCRHLGVNQIEGRFLSLSFCLSLSLTLSISMKINKKLKISFGESYLLGSCFHFGFVLKQISQYFPKTQYI